MKRHFLYYCPYILTSLSIFVAFLPVFAQNKSESSIVLSIESKNIALNEPFIVHITFPVSFKKEYKAAQSIIFPDIPDMEKGKTVYDDDKEFKISQWYWPRKSGKYTCPTMMFKIRDYDVSMQAKTITVKPSKSHFSTIEPKLDEPWIESSPKIELLWLYPKSEVYERQLFDLELSVLVPIDNRVEWNFVDIKEQVQDITKKIGATGLLIHAETDSQIPLDTFERGAVKFYKYTIYKGHAVSVDTSILKMPSLNFHYLSYKTQYEKKGWSNNLSLVNRVAVYKEVSTKPIVLNFKSLPPHPLSNEVAVGNFTVHSNRLQKQQPTKGFNLAFDIKGLYYPLPLHEPWAIQKLPGLHVYLSKQVVTTIRNNQTTRFHYFINSDMPKSINLKNSLIWVFFNPNKHQYDTLSIDQTLSMITSVTDEKNLDAEGSFEQMLYKASNTVYSLEKDESLNKFANFIIFILFIAISVLIFKR